MHVLVPCASVLAKWAYYGLGYWMALLTFFVIHVINTSLVISIIVVTRCLCEERPSLVSPQLTDAEERLSMNTGSQLLATALMSELILVRLSVFF